MQYTYTPKQCMAETSIPGKRSGDLGKEIQNLILDMVL